MFFGGIRCLQIWLNVTMHVLIGTYHACWPGGGFYQRAHSFTIKTLGFTEVDHIEDDTL